MMERTASTKGRVLRSGVSYYDLFAWLLMLGREPALRERLVDLARLAPGDTVLDVGCGTGTLAIAAKRRVGASGLVHGIDASPEMIDWATHKAMKAGVDVAFQTAIVEALPFPDAHFDAVVSTLMLHHLPRSAREQCAREMRRVLKLGGRVLAVDVAMPVHGRGGLLVRLHRHLLPALQDIIELLRQAGLTVVESGSVGMSDLQFALAKAPSPLRDHRDSPAHTSRSLDPLPVPRWILAIVGIAVAVVLGIILRAAL
jgi:ubiquinone/menaquinone biosynthesis C-methylase UbiE